MKTVDLREYVITTDDVVQAIDSFKNNKEYSKYAEKYFVIKNKAHKTTCGLGDAFYIEYKTTKGILKVSTIDIFHTSSMIPIDNALKYFRDIKIVYGDTILRFAVDFDPEEHCEVLDPNKIEYGMLDHNIPLLVLEIENCKN